ncbi:sensor histidine kinase [Actinomadura rupiterrae]|uniref:sensor histidine kinase n=1 Tax=Actinomadura rupiterrae TaxID=559627 RepID=UPI0020A5B360|nr:HAMP domain-containing sensor histidine kinase [Actinomadura rupiterrae]MCP2343682.1 two-component system OmpR family sensor kinase [Actinomadura rupiterrae]
MNAPGHASAPGGPDRDGAPPHDPARPSVLLDSGPFEVSGLVGASGGPGGPAHPAAPAGGQPPPPGTPPPHGGAGFPARVRRTYQRVPLRVKLVVGMLVLVALGLTVMGAAGSAALRGYMIQQADVQVQGTAEKVRSLIIGHRNMNYRVPDNMVVQIWTVPTEAGPTNEALGSGVDSRTSPAFGTRDLAHRVGEISTVTGKDRSTKWRVLAFTEPNGDIVVIGRNLKDVHDTVRQLVTIDITVGILVLGGLGALAALVVSASLRPLRTMEATAEAIARGDLSRRVPDADPATEVGRLGASFNSMLGQIEAAFGAQARSEAAARRSEEAARRSEENALRSEERMRRFVADASHELRTPLTAIRGFAEFYRQGAARTPEELDRLIGRIEETAARMGLLVEDLLLLARLDRQRPVERRPVDLLAVAADAVQETRVVAPDRPIDLDVEGSIAYQILGDEPRLRQVLGNLLTNAVVHTPDGSAIEVRLRPGTLNGAPAAVCEIADHGPGLNPEQAERVFERFYRADKARSREDGGTGLGLAIVAALVAAHEGRVEVDAGPGTGATFRVILPLAPD